MLNTPKSLASAIQSNWAQGNYLYVKWAASHNVNYYELLIFYALDTNGVMTQKAISDYYSVPKQTIHNVIRDLKKADYIILEAGEKDKREKQVSLTSAGKEYAENMLAPLYGIEEQVCRIIGKEKLIQMIETSELFNLLFDKELERETQYE